MNIHEYQAKVLLRRANIPVPPFGVARNMSEVLRVIDEFGLKEGVVKIQVHAGGRGKAGGVKIAEDDEALIAFSKELLGFKLVNNQTGNAGVVSECILLTPKIPIKREFYVAVTYDRELGVPLMIVSPEGGMEIEEIAKNKPDRILKEKIGRRGELHPFQLLRMAKFLGWHGVERMAGMDILKNLAKVFDETDATLFEINPLVETEDGRLLALDAKASFDDNALYRQPGIAHWYDPSQSTPGERLSKDYDIAYVGLDGDIGCMVNGAGLAMATMDIIHQFGGKPSNFLDVGGSATQDKIAGGFKIILQDQNVKAIFVNIFGGIMDCAVLASGIVEAAKSDALKVPLIVRMEGTNVEKGREILRESGLKIVMASDMEDGAKKVVEAAK